MFSKRKRFNRKVVRKTNNRIGNWKAAKPKGVAGHKRSKPAKNMAERVQRKWLYQCAYWRICGSCTMRDHCAKLVKELGVEKSWLTDQILLNNEETQPIKAKTNSRFLTEKEWLNQ